MAKDMYQKRKERKEAKVNNGDSLQKTSINWYPGHMAKTKRQIKEMLNLIDIVVLVVDSRVPKSSFIPDIEEFTTNKEKIIVFSKYDLCDKTETDKWKKYYESKEYKVLYSSLNDNSIKTKLLKSIDESMHTVNKKRKDKGLLPKRARVIVVGAANTGKSTLINLIVGRKALKAANMPGVTKNISVVNINKQIDLLDSPGVLWPKIESNEVALNLASSTIIKEDILNKDDVAIHILEVLKNDYKSKLKEVFGLDDFNKKDLLDYYKQIARFKGLSYKNIEDNSEIISEYIINTIKNGTLKGITFDKM